MPEQTPAQVLDAGEPNRIADALRRIGFGDALTRMAAPVVRSLGSTPALVIVGSRVDFPRPVLALMGMTATVGGNNNAAAFVPDGSAVAATASGGAPPAVHTATIQRDANGLIASVTFSAAPTIPFALVIEAPTNLAARIGAAMS